MNTMSGIGMSGFESLSIEGGNEQAPIMSEGVNWKEYQEKARKEQNTLKYLAVGGRMNGVSHLITQEIAEGLLMRDGRILQQVCNSFKILTVLENLPGMNADVTWKNPHTREKDIYKDLRVALRPDLASELSSS